MNDDTAVLGRIGKLGMAAALIGILGIILFAVGYFSAGSDLAKADVMHSYLFAFVFWGSMTLGCLGLMILLGALKAAWGNPIVRLLEAGGGPVSLLLTAAMFVPLMLGASTIYPWADPARVSGDKILEAKAGFMNMPGVLIRAAILFALWLIWSAIMRKSTRRQDASLDGREWDYRGNWGGIGLVMFFLTVTLAAADWVMSIEPHWFSTIYGLLFAIGAAMSAMSMLVWIVLINAQNQPYRDLVTPKLSKDYGNLLFTLTMLWAYMTLSQFLIIWQGNLPQEATYYLSRTQTVTPQGLSSNWNILSITLIVCQFFVPFLVLLAPRTKHFAKNLLWVAVLIFFVRIVNVYWSVMPSLRPSLISSLAHWTDYAAFLGLGGIWIAVFVSQVKRSPLVPRYDTRLLEAEHA